jgi:hypothetical protein
MGIGLQIRLYSTWKDIIRFGLEIIIAFGLTCDICWCCFKVLGHNATGHKRQKRAGLIASMLTDIGVVCAIAFWWLHTIQAQRFSMSTTYDVYEDLIRQAHRLEHSESDARGLQQAVADMAQVDFHIAPCRLFCCGVKAASLMILLLSCRPCSSCQIQPFTLLARACTSCISLDDLQSCLDSSQDLVSSHCP